MKGIKPVEVFRMKIIMLETREGAPRGFETFMYVEGSVYSVPQQISMDLAKVFIRQKWARKQKPESGTKDRGAAPENKSANSVIGRIKKAVTRKTAKKK